jgi:3D (Asp-Asp-Asp) domain-containing protein
MARHTGIPVDTLRRYKRMPETIPLERLILIAREMGVAAEDIGGAIVGRTA